MSAEVETPPVEQPEVVKSEEEAKVEENHVEENKPEEGEEASDKPKDGEVAEEAKKEENGTTPPKLKLHQPGPSPNVPSSLPSCLAMETYLRMNKIPYENVYVTNTKYSTNKVKMPFIEYQGDKVQDAKFCIQYINKKFEVDPDKSLTAEQKAICHAFQVMADENTYWCLAYYRWVDNFQDTKKYYNNLSPIVKNVKPKMDQSKCIKCMEGHGIGKHTKEEIYSIAEFDLRSINSLLGDKEFFMGSEPTTIDCTMFGLLANFVYDAQGSPQEKLMREELKPLVDFCDRMKLDFWMDWNDVCSEEHVEEFKPKGRLSVKKKKVKTQEAKEDKGTTEQKDEGKSGDDADTKDGEEAESKPEESAKGEADDDAKPSEEDEEKKEEKTGDEAAAAAEPEASPSEEKTEEKPAEE